MVLGFDDSELLKRWEMLIEYMHPHLDKFPKTQRHRMVAKIESEHYAIHSMLVESNVRWLRAVRSDILKEVDVKLKIYTFSLRLAHKAEYLKTKQWEQASKIIVEFGRMLGSQINKK